jgi:threonine dehydrogenase-like Zn-dependent dehydrogenase
MVQMMRTAVMVEPGVVQIWQVPVPVLGQRQVLVKVAACAICTWEQRMYRGAGGDAAGSPYPFRGGHEVAGVVAAKSPDAMCDAKVGDRVAVAVIVRCGACYFCRRGLDNLCQADTGQAAPGEIWGPGGLSDYVVVRDENVYRAWGGAEDPTTATTNGSGVGMAELALSEPVACVVRSVEKGGLVPGDTALVQGAGIMGLLHLQLLQRQGVRVLVADPDAARREMALRLGATAVCDPFDLELAGFARRQTEGRGVEAAFFTAGGPSAVEVALGTLVRGGYLVLYGSIHPRDPITVDANRLHYDELTVTGTFTHSRRSFQQAVDLLSAGLLQVQPLISERVPLAEVERAFSRAASSDTYRVVVTFDE